MNDDHASVVGLRKDNATEWFSLVGVSVLVSLRCFDTEKKPLLVLDKSFFFS